MNQEIRELMEDLTDEEIKYLADLAGQDMGAFDRWVAARKLERKSRNTEIIVGRVQTLVGRDEMLATVAERHAEIERLKKRRAHEDNLESVHQATQIMTEGYVQEYLTNAVLEIHYKTEDIEYRRYEREVKKQLTQKALDRGLDLPTYLRVMEAEILSNGPSAESKRKMEDFKAKLEAESLQPLLLLGIVRKKLAELRTELFILENTESQGELKDQLIADLKRQIEACEAQQRGYETEMGKKGGRKQVLGGDQPNSVPEPPILGDTARK